jgi:hypothetical protein
MLTDVRRPILTPRPVLDSVEELLAGATERRPFLTSDSKSGSGFERVLIDGEPHVLKHVHVDGDWTMRFSGDERNNPLQVWRSGLMDLVPEHVEHGVVGVAGGLGRDGLGAAILMRDLSAELAPEGDALLTLEQHRGYLDTMAALGAAAWGWVDDIGMVELDRRWTWFSDANLADERQRGWPNPVPKIAAEGWDRLAERAPAALVELLHDLRNDPQPLLDALATSPCCFIHGDWKLGNVGTAADGRTVLIDWTYPGSAPIAHDLGWYLALNRARLPESKDDSIAALQRSLEAHGVDTAGWYEHQVAVCLLGALVEFGWEKALGDEAELGWWCDRGEEGARLL